MSKLKIELDRSKEPQFFEDTFNDLSADIEERLAAEHLKLKNNHRCLIIGSREAFNEYVQQVMVDSAALIHEQNNEN